MLKDFNRQFNQGAMRIVVIACLLIGVTSFDGNDCFAQNNKQKHSADYKAFPTGSPEAVVTAFIETDLGDVFNRENDERYHLWWDLTEKGGAPEDCQRLIIDSYKIARKRIEARTGDVIVDLEMNVCAIQLMGVISREKYETTNYCRWRSIVRTNENRFSLVSPKEFLEHIFGKNNISANILQKKDDYYIVPKG
jgi:hypothetical protein